MGCWRHKKRKADGSIHKPVQRSTLMILTAMGALWYQPSYTCPKLPWPSLVTNVGLISSQQSCTKDNQGVSYLGANHCSTCILGSSACTFNVSSRQYGCDRLHRRRLAHQMHLSPGLRRSPCTHQSGLATFRSKPYAMKTLTAIFCQNSNAYTPPAQP